MSENSSKKNKDQKIFVDLPLHLLLMWDLDGIIQYGNFGWTEKLGYESEELIGRKFLDFVHPDDKKATINELNNFSKGITTFTFENRYRLKDGTYNTFQWAANVNLEKRIFFGIAHDVSELKKIISENERNLKEAQAIAHIGHWKLNPISLEVSGSDELFNIFDLNDDANILEAFSEVVHPDDKEFDLNTINRGMKEGIAWDIEHRLITKNGIEKWVHAIGEPIKDETGKVINVLGTIQDITERKKLEKNLQESEVKYREAFNRAEIYKDLFAHDISNILQNIKTSNGLLKLWKDNPEDSNIINEVIQIVDNQVLRGAKLISNIQKLSQVSKKVESLKKIGLMEKLNEAIQFIQKSYSGRLINIKIDSLISEPTIIGNDLLLDIFENLLINAVKYNENSEIKILIKVSRATEDDIKYYKFEFIDNGIGISDIMKEGIFNGTTKSEDKTKGMGLGLILVRKIILSFKGKVWVENAVKGDLSQGSNFIILLPEVL